MTGAVLLTTHSVVAILTVGEFARETGLRVGIGAYRRANLLDVTVCTWPFTLPYFLPAILAANATAAGAPFGMPRVSPLATGVHNVYSWALLGMVVFAVVAGYGRSEGPSDDVNARYCLSQVATPLTGFPWASVFVTVIVFPSPDTTAVSVRMTFPFRLWTSLTVLASRRVRATVSPT